MSYIEGFIVPVPRDKQEPYRAMAESAAEMFKEFGAIRHMEAWEDEVPEGKLTDYRRAVQATADEVIVFSFIEYPDRATRDAANQKLREDPRMQDMSDLPFDAGRMIYGGFEAASDTGEQSAPAYIDGSLMPVPADKREPFLAEMKTIGAFSLAHGATRVVEGWEDDVPEGKVTDFARSVARESGEKVVFSWIEWPSKDVRNAAWGAMMQDPELQSMGHSFDAKRMVHGGFKPIFDWDVRL